MTRPTSRGSRLVLILLLPALLSLGCIFRGPGGLRRDLSSAAGVELEREMGVTLGRTSTWLAKKALKWSGETEVSLRGLRKLTVGVYEVRGLRPGHEARDQLSLDDLPDWTPLVQVHEGDSDVFVLTRKDDLAIRKMLVVVADEDEWVIVKLQGRLDRILEDAMKMAFDEADKPGLYEATRRERGLDLLEDSGPTLDAEVGDDDSDAEMSDLLDTTSSVEETQAN